MFASLPISRLQATVEEQLQVALEDKENLEFALECADEHNDLLKDTNRKQKSRLKLKSKETQDVRICERRKAAEKTKAERKKDLAVLKAERLELANKAVAAAQQRVKAEVEKLKRFLAAARKRARDKEDTAKLSTKRLKRATKAEKLVKELQELLEEEEGEESGDEVEEIELTKGDELHFDTPKTSGKRRRDERGRLVSMSNKTRVLVWAQLARRVAPSQVAANISDVISSYAPNANELMPSERTVQKMRGELTIAGEAIAAFRIAAARRIISFGFDESTKYGLGVVSNNVQLEPHDAPGTSEDVVPRGACLIAGGKATEVAAAIDKKIFQHGRTLLRRWKERHEKRNGAGSWALAGGPDPEALGLHRLTEHTTIISDTCNAARAAKRLLAEMAMEAAKEKMGADAWDALSEDERSKQVAIYLGDCSGHLRNIIINAMVLAGSSYLSSELSDSLGEFSSFDRVSVDGIDWIRSAYKQFHGGGEYAKGKGREFVAWLKKNHPDEFFMPFENAHGSRMDISFDGMAPIFANRVLMAKFLNQLVNAPGANDNRLEESLWRVLKCNEMTALARVSTLFKYVLSEPMRWLTGKASKQLDDWSLASSSNMFDLLESALTSIANDGHALLDPHLDPFRSIELKQPLFAKHLAEMRTHRIHARVLAEARNPAGKGNIQATEKVVALAERMANAGLAAMRDGRRAIADKLTSQDGANSVGNLGAAHEKTKGDHQMNDHVESNFGCYDNVAHMFRYATVENLSGIAQQMRNQARD